MMKPVRVVLLAVVAFAFAVVGVPAAQAASATVNDSGFTYTGQWVAGGSATQPEHWSYTNGATASVAFTVASGGGTVTFRGSRAAANHTVGLHVDNGAEVQFNENGSGFLYDAAAWTSGTLAAGSHTLYVRNIASNASVSSATVSNGSFSAAPVTFALQGLSASVSGNSVTANLSVTASANTTIPALGVCVRDSAGGNVDYPQNTNVPVGPSTAANFTATKTFANGTYTYFGCIFYNGAWQNLGNASFTTPSSAPPPPPPPSGGPAAGKSLRFSDPFNSLSVGSPGNTWSYKTPAYQYGDHNPNDHKLDWTTPSAMSVANGVLTISATPRPDGYWNTGLLTTDPSQGVGGNGVRLQPGDFYVARVRMPDSPSVGSWPAEWAWDNSFTRGGEIDPFEYHTDNPNLLEIGTSQCQCGSYYTNANLVAPGKWVWIGMAVSDTNNVAYVGDTLADMTQVWQDNTGLQGARPYPMINESISNGDFHPRPSGSGPLVFQVDEVDVYH